MHAYSVMSDQAPTSMGFSMQEYWSGLPFPPSGGFPDPILKNGFLEVVIYPEIEAITSLLAKRWTCRDQLQFVIYLLIGPVDGASLVAVQSLSHV